MSLYGVVLQRGSWLVGRLDQLLLWKINVVAEYDFSEEHLAVVLRSESVARTVACILGEVNSAAPHRAFPAEPHIESFLTLNDHRRVSFRGTMPKQRLQRLLSELLRELLTLHLVSSPEVDVLDDFDL